MKKKKDSIVLGRTLSHENSACILRNGAIVAAIATERLTRHKYDHANNDRAILYCLETSGITMDDVDVIVQNTPKHYFRAGSESKLIDDNDSRVWTISHHLAHAWAAFGTSPFKCAVVVVIDGRGNFVPQSGDVIISPHSSDNIIYRDGGCDWAIEVESVYLAEEQQLKLLYRNRNRGLPSSIGSQFSKRPGLYPDEYSGYYQYAGLGAMYEQVSYGIFGSSLDGGKVMGLAAFAKPNAEQVARIIQIDRSDESYTLGTRWLHKIGGPISVDEDFSKAASIASSVQRALELGVQAIMRRAQRFSNARHLCYTGGVSLNCCVNEQLILSGLFDDVFIQPACNDAGTAIGCALFGYTQVLRGQLHHKRYLDFTGCNYDNTIDDSLRKWLPSVVAHRLNDVISVACDILCSGKIIGWYRGGSEFGPRALGHRSILALPHPKSVKNRINKAIKRREAFRPFAPIVPLEDAQSYFDLSGESPYMLRVVAVRPQYKAILEAVTHVDGTARVQTVKYEDDPVLHRLLRAVGSAYGIPVLLNTSFNMAGFPMVETPDDAIICFLTSGLDFLFINNYLLERRYPTSTSVRAQKQHVRWRLAPGVEIVQQHSVNGVKAWLQLGPRKRQIKPADVEFLWHLKDLANTKEQEETHPEPALGKELLDDLFADGWIVGSGISTPTHE